MSALGKLVVSLSLEHASFTKGLDKSSQEALRFAKNSQDSFDKFERSAKNSIGSVVQNVLGLAAAYVSVTGAIGALNSSINTLAKLDDMAQKTGSSVESLSRLQKVASQFGADFNAIDVAVGKLAKGLAGIDDEGGKTAKALNAIGISQKFVKDNDPSEVMIEVAKKLQNYQDGASKAALATDLFGKAGIELLPYLNDVADNVDRFAGVSGEAAAKAAKLQDDLGALKVSFSQLVDEVTIGMLPAMTSFIGKLNQILQFKSIFSSVGGIDEKDYDKELSKRVEGLKSLEKSRANLSKPTLANKINDFVFGDVGDLDRQITIYKDEIKALKDLKTARDAVTGSPYVSPNDEKKKLEYKGADVESKLNSARDAAAAKEAAANKKLFEERLKELQREVSEEFESAETIAKFKIDKEKEIAEAKKELDDKEYKRQLKQNDLLQEVSEKNFKEAQDKAKEIADEAKRAADDINRSLTDALLRGFESGKGFAENFRETLVNLFKTLILQPVVKFLVDSSGISAVMGALGSVFSGGANASALLPSGGGGFGFGSLKDIGSVITKGFDGANIAFEQGIQQFGTFVTEFGGVGESIGGFISQYSSAISNVLPYAGAALSLLKGDFKGAAFQAAGVAIGSAIGGPIGGAIGSVLGSVVGGLFGGKKQPPRQAGQASASFIDGQLLSSNGKVAGRTTYNTGLAGGVESALSAFTVSLGSLLKSFGGTGNVTASGYYSGRAKGSAYYGLTAMADGVSTTFNQRDKKAFGEANFNQFIEKVLGVELVKAIQASSLPVGIKKFFDGLTKKEDVLDAINTLGALKVGLKDLPAVFNAVRNAMDTTAYDTSIAALKAQFAATQTFVSLFYSESEQFDTFTKQLVTQLTAINSVLPTSRDAYRALVDSITVVDDATRNQFNGLVSLAPAMDAYFKQLEAQKNKLDEVANSLRDVNSFTTLTDYQRYQGIARNFGNKAANDSLNNSPAIVDELKLLRAELATLRISNEATAASSRKTADLLTQVTEDGNALLTVAA